MQTQQANGTTEGGAPTMRSWRLLLLILLVLLPVTMALASPEPFHAPSASAVQHDAGVHTHGPSDTPTCHHVGHHGGASALVSDNRDADFSAPGDTGAAIPSQGPAHSHVTVAEAPLHAVPSDHLRPTLAVYLRTQRLRV